MFWRILLFACALAGCDNSAAPAATTDGSIAETPDLAEAEAPDLAPPAPDLATRSCVLDTDTFDNCLLLP